jgi:hypothetical protein
MTRMLLVSFALAALVVGAAQGAPGSSPCKASQLSVRTRLEDGGVGHFGTYFVLTNKSGRACFVKGYLGLRLLNAKRAPMPTSVSHGPAYLVDSSLVRRVMVAPGGHAQAWVEWSDVPSGDEPVDKACEPTSAYIRVTPPGQTVGIVIPFREMVCGHGGLTTTPLTR